MEDGAAAVQDESAPAVVEDYEDDVPTIATAALTGEDDVHTTAALTGEDEGAADPMDTETIETAQAEANKLQCVPACLLLTRAHR